MRTKIVLTGAAGRIGGQLRAQLSAACQTLVLVDQVPLVCRHANEVALQLDLADLDGLTKALAGAEAVVHFAGYPREADWDTLIQSNVVSVVNLWEAARINGVGRVVYASSNHAVGMYPRSQILDAQSLSAADSRYGITKVFMESVAQLYATKHGLRGFGMRIGHCALEPTDARMLSHWIHPEDMGRLVRVGLDADYLNEVVYGVSRNSRSWWNNERAAELGYLPQHSADPFIAGLESVRSNNAVAEFYQGGSFAAAEFTNAELMEKLSSPCNDANG